MLHRHGERLRVLPLLLPALALLLGLLAMHAVGGGPHSLHGVDHPMGPAGGAMERLDPAMHVMTAPAGLVADAAGPGSRDVPGSPSGAMAAMCVVMLLSLVIALAYGVVGRAPRRADAPVVSRPVGWSGRPLRAPPPDLLTRLCVLRT